MKRFEQGQRLFMVISNLTVQEVQLVRYFGGRCVVRYPGYGFEREGQICVSENRLFLTKEAAAATIRKHRLPDSHQPSIPEYVYREARIDEPGDGWARRQYHGSTIS